MNAPLKPKSPSRRFAAANGVKILLVLLALFLAGTALSSCAPAQPRTPAMAPCATCRGGGVFGLRSCPSCQGLGFIHIKYRYRV
ncbi:MAG: hypothetical protein ACYTFG_11715, partial [Planctomycetota bacterium]